MYWTVAFPKLVYGGEIRYFYLHEIDEYDTAILSTSSQPSVSSTKTAPIIIKMQPKSQSPPLSIAATRAADIVLEDEKTSDSDHTAPRFVKFLFICSIKNYHSYCFFYSLKEVHANEEITDALPLSSITESEIIHLMISCFVSYSIELI